LQKAIGRPDRRTAKSDLIAFRVHFDYFVAKQSSAAERINDQEDRSFAL